MSHANNATPPPTTACAAITRQGDSCGFLALSAAASSGVRRLYRSSAASSASQSRHAPEGRFRSDIVARLDCQPVVGKPRDYTETNDANDSG
jgi:hypothetical protein